jgi:hypothetical protein
VSACISAIKRAASIQDCSEIFLKGRIAQRRLPICGISQVGFTQVIIFFIIYLLISLIIKTSEKLSI